MKENKLLNCCELLIVKAEELRAELQNLRNLLDSLGV